MSLQDTDSMVTPETTSQKTQDSKYAIYEALNKEALDKESPAGTGDAEYKADVDASKERTADIGTPETPRGEEEPRKRESGHDRSIRRLTAQREALREESARKEAEWSRRFAELEAKVSPKESPKPIERKNYDDDTQYINELTNRKVLDTLAEREETVAKTRDEQARQAAEQEKFRSSWQGRVQSNYTSPEDIADFADLVETSPNNLHADIHDFVRNSDVGPRMMHAMLLRPDYVESINGLPASVRTARLLQLEDAVYKVVEGERTQKSAPPAQTTKVSRAPAPTGQLGTRGAPTSDDGDDTQAAVLAYQRKKFGR